MRRLFWCGTAATFASAAAVYFAADQAARQPYSLIGRSTLIAYEVGTASQPLCWFSEIMCQQIGAMVKTVATAKLSLPETNASPGVNQQAGNNTSETEPVTREELQRLHLLSLLHSPETLIQITPKTVNPQQKDVNPEAEMQAVLSSPITLPLAMFSEAKQKTRDSGVRETTPRIMPFARAYDEKKVLALMPLAKAFDETTVENSPSTHSFWTRIFHQDFSICARPEEGSTEESGAIQESFPGFHEYPTTFSLDVSCPLTKKATKPDGSSSGISSGNLGQESTTFKPVPLEGNPREQGNKTPAQQHIDTMEFRPSDAQEGEFDNHPM